MATPAHGTGNYYPYGQCTWWAQNRYHQLTGIYVPWSGDAHSWNSLALAYGWTVSGVPSKNSIICLQPLVQGAGILGHVGIVESINGGSVTASSMNWGSTTAEQLSVTSWTFTPGVGVSFITATPSTGGTATLTNTVPTALPSVSDITSITNWFTGLSGLFAWTNTPTRIFKLIGGLLCMGIAIYIFVKPYGEQVAAAAAKAGMFA